MKKGIHPKYYPNAKVICACGNVFIVGATKEVIHTDVCSACHPFFTGEQRIVDTGGRVERFKRRLEKGKMKATPEKKAEKPEEAAGEPAAEAKAPAKKGTKAKRASPKAAEKDEVAGEASEQG